VRAMCGVDHKTGAGREIEDAIYRENSVVEDGRKGGGASKRERLESRKEIMRQSS